MNWRKRLAKGIAGLGLLLGLTACTISSEALDELASRLTGENPWEESQEQEAQGQESQDGDLSGQAAEPSAEEKTFGSVLYFRDDAGQNTQLKDGWLYGYWSRKLCRINRETMEEEVLFETCCPQNGIFCIEGDRIYFLEETAAGESEIKVSLCRMRRDGSDFTVLEPELVIPKWGAYELDCYDGVLYLTGGGTEPENLYFRIEGDGTVSRIEEDETLYGRLPEGFFLCDRKFEYDNLPRLPYCMRNYGYVFVRDNENELYRMDLETGVSEKVPLAKNVRKYSVFLTNDSIVYRDGENIWYRRSLDDLSEVTRLGYWRCYSVDFYDEEGLYHVERTNDGMGGTLSVEMLAWSGETRTVRKIYQVKRLRSTLCGDNLNLKYFDGSYLYFDVGKNGDGVVMRLTVARTPNKEGQVTLYYENPAKDICTRETNRLVFQTGETEGQGELTFTKVMMTGDTPAAEKINALLWEEEFDLDDAMESLRKFVRETAGEEWVGYLKSGYKLSEELLAEMSIYSDINYLDERYIGICVGVREYIFYAGDATYGTVNYLFDRATGERLKITDVVADSKEVIGELFLPYVREKSTWRDWEEDEMRESVFEEDRLFLTPEGVGVHYDVYEVGGYSEGSVDIVVPWDCFTKK